MLDSFWFYPDFVWNHLPLKMKKFHTKYLASWRYVFISWSMVSLFTNILVRSTSQTKKIKFSWTFETQLRQRFLTLCVIQIAAILKMMGVKSCVLKKIYNLKLCWKIYFLCVVFVCNYFPIIDYREEEL